MFEKNIKIKYYAFEPSPVIYKVLKLNIKSKNAYLYNLALHDKMQSKKFDLLDKNVNSSLIRFKNYTNFIRVKCITLDMVVKQIGVNIKLIKIDAESGKPEVLNGLKKYCYKVKYISVEAGEERGINHTNTFLKCNKILISKNFILINKNTTLQTYLFKNKIFK